MYLRSWSSLDCNWHAAINLQVCGLLLGEIFSPTGLADPLPKPGRRDSRRKTLSRRSKGLQTPLIPALLIFRLDREVTKVSHGGVGES